MKYEYKVISMIVAAAIFTHILFLGVRKIHLGGGTILAILLCGGAIIGALHALIPDKTDGKRDNPPD